MTLKVAFSVDDVAPTPGYGLLMQNDPLVWLEKLHEEFGCKFTLFCIPLLNGEEKNNWNKNKTWVNKIKNINYYEIAQHGLTHQAQKPEYGAQEFLGLSTDDIFQRISLGKQIFNSVGIDVKGFKAPGWYLTPDTYRILEECGFDYIADHFFGNTPIKQEKIYRIPYTISIEKITHLEHDDYLIFHSHINPEGGNKNGWTKELYEHMRRVLKTLEELKDVEYVTMSELLTDYKNDKN